eukprot:Polyplicarium_translucidae@DN605_c0_g1_i1.p1
MAYNKIRQSDISRLSFGSSKDRRRKKSSAFLKVTCVLAVLSLCAVAFTLALAASWSQQDADSLFSRDGAMRVERFLEHKVRALPQQLKEKVNALPLRSGHDAKHRRMANVGGVEVFVDDDVAEDTAEKLIARAEDLVNKPLAHPPAPSNFDVPVPI